MDYTSKIILIAGPTASGKSKIAINLAKKINGEIVNADSMQVYKQLKILTSRPSKKDQKNIKHHSIGFVDVQTVITQLLSYFRVITNPKAVYLTTEIFTDNQISDEDAKNRLKEMVDETLELASKLKKE